MTKELQYIDYNVTVLTNSLIANGLAPGAMMKRTGATFISS